MGVSWRQFELFRPGGNIASGEMRRPVRFGRNPSFTEVGNMVNKNDIRNKQHNNSFFDKNNETVVYFCRFYIFKSSGGMLSGFCTTTESSCCPRCKLYVLHIVTSSPNIHKTTGMTRNGWMSGFW
jgi:hypothetical protein